MANRRKRIAYNEGDWFAVPVYTGFAVGVVSRKGKHGILAGHFFGPIESSLPDLERVSELTPDKAVYRCHFGDVGIVEGEWPIIGSVPAWDREEWALHRFLAGDPSTRQCTVVEYDPDNPTRQLGRVRATDEECETLPISGMAGHIYVEHKLALYFRLPTDRMITPNWQSELEKARQGEIERMTRKSAMALFFDEDTAFDTKGDFTKAMRKLRNPVAAALSVMETNAAAADDFDHGPVMRAALAILLIDRGVTDHELITSTRTEIQSGNLYSILVGENVNAERQRYEKAFSLLLGQ